MFTDRDKILLLKIARETIESRLNDLLGKTYTIKSESLKKKSGAFVTIYYKGNLRGCVGYISDTKQLHRVVREMAIAAAFNDDRFQKLTKEEFEDIKIEISVISPFKTIENTKEIEIGKHGLVIMHGWNSGLLLPQVAIRNKWDRKKFLEETCNKAGLHKDMYKDHTTTIQTFTAEIIKEEEFKDQI